MNNLHRYKNLYWNVSATPLHPKMPSDGLLLGLGDKIEKEKKGQKRKKKNKYLHLQKKVENISFAAHTA